MSPVILAERARIAREVLHAEGTFALYAAIAAISAIEDGKDGGLDPATVARVLEALERGGEKPSAT